jgi:hypothetical protein
MGVVPPNPRAASTAAGRTAESILVHGDDDLAISAVAIGLARRTTESFAWVDFEDPRESARSPARSWVEDRSGRPVVDLVEASLLRPPDRDRLALRRLIAPERTKENARLQSHLAMPELFQRLAARAISPDGRGVVLLANVDRLPPALRSNTIETAWLHRTLHDEGLTVIGTARAPPSEAMRRAFDRVFRVEVADQSSWEEGELTEEKRDGREGSGPPIRLRTAWGHLGLDPALLSMA